MTRSVREKLSRAESRLLTLGEKLAQYGPEGPYCVPIWREYREVQARIADLKSQVEDGKPPGPR
jgi:hypothetical protein